VYNKVHPYGSWCIIWGSDVIGELLNLGNTIGQSEKIKVGAANPALTNCQFTNWRSKMHGKTQLG